MSTLMTIRDATGIARRARKLMRQGRITAKQFVVIDCLLWACRSPNGSITVSYSALQRLCHCARQTAVDAIRVLARLRILTVIKRRVRVVWGASTASRQLMNAYILHPATESSQWTDIKNDRVQETIVETPARVVAHSQDLLAARRRAVTEGWLTNKGPLVA